MSRWFSNYLEIAKGTSQHSPLVVDTIGCGQFQIQQSGTVKWPGLDLNKLKINT